MSMWKTLHPILERLAAEKMLVADIAAELTKLWGRPVTRNMVIGRANRTGIRLTSPREATVLRSARTQKTPFYPCGHPRTPDNSYNCSSNPHCRICNLAHNKRWRKAQQAAALLAREVHA